MRWLIALLLLQAQRDPIPVPAHAEWIGTVEYSDSGGVHIGPVVADLTMTDGAISGRWVGRRSNTPPSGTITGTIKDGKLKLTVSFFSAGAIRRPDGSEESVGPERCSGEGSFTGTLTPTGVLRFTASTLAFDTTTKRVQGRECENIRHVIWTLQPHQH